MIREFGGTGPMSNYAVEFALDEALTYLNHAGMGPWPARTANAVQAFALDNIHRGALAYDRWTQTEDELRRQLQRLVNAPSAQDIALLKSTSEGLSFVASGLEWKTGDNIVSSNQEFPSNRLPWESLSDQGVELRQVALCQTGESPEQALIAACDARTRLLTVSSVQFASGLSLDLEVLGAFCSQREILFCVDAIQSIGALRVDVQAWQADFVAADGHKWMLGPEGIALFYVREAVRERLRPQEFGWHMVEALGDYDRRDWRPAAGARRYECGSPNMLGIQALHASLSLLEEIGMTEVEAQVLARSRFTEEWIAAATALERVGLARQRSGIVSFRHRHEDSQQVYQRLKGLGVVCALRAGAVRFSAHFYTPLDRIEQALEWAVQA